jgi:hypothetical protein
MSTTFLPKLPEGYSWQLCAEDSHEVTSDYYAESDAVEARIWHEAGDGPEIVLKRTGEYGHWGAEGLRKWVIDGPCPAGLMDWEQFETLSEVSRRIKLTTGD